ncbi:MAG TPA: FecR family protein [Bacteroidales bacterium]|nr:FecR family protein [Bacteroidales bacterium]
MRKTTNSGKFTDKEWEKLASILSGEETENPDLINRFMKDDLHNTGNIWKDIKDMSNIKNIDVEKAWQNVSSKISQTEIESADSKVLTLRETLLRIAAAVLVLISIGTGAFYIYHKGAFSTQVAFSTGNDEKNLLVELSDGSRIFLNRNSELTYLKDFGKKNRNVKLRGEAFFEIAADAAKPFTIDAGNATVKVVGTSFNIITSNNNSEVEVFVKSGKVLLSGSDNSGSIELDPGYVGKIDAGKTEKKINNDLNYLSWNTGLLVYNGQTLDVVFKDLKRVYNMDIIAEDNSILENRWTSPIDNQSQETIIRLICVSFNLSYTQDGNVYHLVKK